MYRHHRYVHPSGDDRWDGLSWDTAKKTIMAAFDEIEGGDIFIGSEYRDGRYIGVQAHAGGHAGIWITEDLELLNLDPHWRWPKPVRFIGTGPCRSQFGNPAALIDVKARVPSIWLWDTSEHNYFENLNLNRPIWIGIAPEYWGKIGNEHGNVWANVQSRAAYQTTDGITQKRIRGAVALARFIGVRESHPVFFYQPILEADGRISTTHASDGINTVELGPKR